jgi:para-aminobenzoate synthetase component 1
VPSIHPDFLGFASYEYGYTLDAIRPKAAHSPFGFPGFRFVLYRGMKVFDHVSGILYEADRDGTPKVEEGPNLLVAGPFRARKVWDSDTPEGYREKVALIREEIAKGNVYQVNLTRQERWAYEGDLREFAQRLYRANPAPYSAFIAEPGFSIVSSSPERFLRIDGKRIETRPIKGTAPRGATAVEDETLRRNLLGSGKNRAELAMIADLLRNDLTQICKVPSVQVEAYPVLETYANVHHLVATVAGELRPGFTLEELFRALFPGGSITGCPKLAAIHVIRQLEENPRAIYTGALGWFSQDLSQMDLSIPIRTAWASPRELWFGVGGGVMWDSSPEEEYMETVHKGSSLVQCLSS